MYTFIYINNENNWFVFWTKMPGQPLFIKSSYSLRTFTVALMAGPRSASRKSFLFTGNLFVIDNCGKASPFVRF